MEIVRLIEKKWAGVILIEIKGEDYKKSEVTFLDV
jgi:hypothetical protein